MNKSPITDEEVKKVLDEVFYKQIGVWVLLIVVIICMYIPALFLRASSVKF